MPDRGKNITVDKERSVIPEGVGISDDGRTLVLPHTGTEILLAADCDEELELVPVSEDLISVETDLSAGTNVFRISKKLFAPGDGMIVKDIVFRRKGLENIYPDDRITLKMEANPTVLVGKIRFGQGVYSYDFGTYADNEFGVFTLPEGKKISVEFADGEDRWMTVEPSGEVVWEDVLFLLQAGESAEDTIELSQGYDRLEDGQYRLVKWYFLSEEEIPLYLEFIVDSRG